jgi:hypothetical protein
MFLADDYPPLSPFVHGVSVVTETLIRFEEQGLIRKMRGVLQVGDRKRLEQKACCCYGIIASAYEAVECPAQTERTAEASV